MKIKRKSGKSIELNLLHSFLEKIEHQQNEIRMLRANFGDQKLRNMDEIQILNSSIDSLKYSHQAEIQKLKEDRENMSIEFQKRVKVSDLLFVGKEKIPVLQYNFNTSSSQQLAKLFDEFGSDKSTRHGYENFYSYLLSILGGEGILIEIGVGSNNTNVTSHMKPNYKVAGSLEVWANELPNWKIVGIDIDPSCALITSEKYSILTADQTSKPQMLNALDSAELQLIDVVIDDGLHEPGANLACLRTVWPRLKAGGHYIIEDIPQEHLLIWQHYFENLNLDCEKYIVETKELSKMSFDSNMLMLKKR